MIHEKVVREKTRHGINEVHCRAKAETKNKSKDEKDRRGKGGGREGKENYQKSKEKG